MTTENTPAPYLVADLFCGAGGSSTGAKRAIEAAGGRMELVAVNHWQTAIKTHSANHPDARHVVEDVSIVDPEEVVPEGRLDLLMASPECRYHSRARGGKPIHDQGRMNPWAIHNWLTRLDVKCVLVENVPEFTKWGPLDEHGKVIKAKRGEYFQAWFLAFAALGYEAEWRMLNAADYGDATTRVRFFLIARKDGKPIIWPHPTHAKVSTPLMPGLLPWRGAREIIDWHQPGNSMFDHPKYVKQPLCENTRRRIAKGLEKFAGHWAPWFIDLLDLPDHQAVGLTPDQLADAQPFILNRHGENGGSRTHDPAQPLPAATTRGAGYLVQPQAEPFTCANRNGNAPRDIDAPIAPATTAPGGGSFLVEPEAKPFTLGQQSGYSPREVEDPIATICTGGKISLVTPHIVRYQGTSDAENTDAPLSTITTNNKHGLVQPNLVQYYGKSHCSDIEQPLPTVTTKDRHALVSPAVIQVNHGNGDDGHKGDNRRVHSTDTPLPAITTRPGLYLSQPIMDEITHVGENAEPATNGQVKAIDPRRLVSIDGRHYLLDIKFRMLNNDELARAMGFDDQEDRYEFHGKKSHITKQIGNAVAVGVATALVSAILSE